MKKNELIAAIGGLGLATVIALGVSAGGNGGYPPTGNGGSPTPIFDDPPVWTDGTVEIPVETETPVPTETPFPTVILPETGSGSTYGN